MIALSKQIDDHTTLVRSYDSPDMLDAFRSEVFRETDEVVADYSALVTPGKDPDKSEQRLSHIAAGTRFAPDLEHVGKGTCFGHLVIQGDQDGEWFHVAFRSRSMPDVALSVYMNSTLQEFDKGLLARDANGTREMRAAGIDDSAAKALRKGKTEIAGRPAEQVLYSILQGESHDKKALLFTAETAASPSTLAAPNASISLYTGGQLNGEYVDSSLTDEAAMQLWDTILRSVRPRPGAL